MTIDLQSLTFPNELHFRTFVQVCNESPHHVQVHDQSCGIDASYGQMLRDIQATRQSIVNSLRPSMFGRNRFILSGGETLFVSVLAPGNYEFLVAALSVLATGGALLPFATSISPEEATYPLQKCKSTCLLASPALLQRAMDIQRHEASLGRKVVVLPIQTETSSAILPTATIDENAVIEPSRPCLALFASGTTGPPKGVVLPRRLLETCKLARGNAVRLVCRGPQHIGGCIGMLKPVFIGTTLDIVPRDATVLWERLRKWDSTVLSSTPPGWQQMMDFFQNRIAHLPTEERDQYIRGARGICSAIVWGAAAPPSLLKFWCDLGRPLTTVYGSTELGGMGFMSTDETDPDLKCCIGRPLPGVTMRLSEGDEGELLIKTPGMFTHFLDDEAATQAAFTSDGFYKTGDQVRRVGDDYVFLGRASTDFIRYYGHKIPVLELESHLVNIPCIVEAHVLSVPDAHTCARVAVLVRFSSSSSNGLDLGYIRSHLSEKLAPYKLPTIMRTLQEGDSVYRTETGKVTRGKTREKFFPVSDSFALPPEIKVWRDDNDNNKNSSSSSKAI